MNKGIAIASLIGLGLIGCANGKHEDHHSTMDLTAAPQAVQDAVKKAIGTNKLEHLKMETEDGKTIYEAEYEVGEVDHTVSISAAGELLEEEWDVEVKDLPAKVADAVKAKYPAGKIEKAELSKKDGASNYELEVEVSEDVDHEVVVDQNGAITKDEVLKEEDEGHDEKDEKGEK